VGPAAAGAAEAAEAEVAAAAAEAAFASDEDAWHLLTVRAGGEGEGRRGG